MLEIESTEIGQRDGMGEPPFSEGFVNREYVPALTWL